MGFRCARVLRCLGKSYRQPDQARCRENECHEKISHRELLLLESLSVELLSIREREAMQSHDFPASLGEKSGNSELISFLNHVLLPANPGQHVWTVGFHTPLLDLALIVFYVKRNKYVRIGPLKTGHGSFQGDGVFLVKCRTGMVGEQWNRYPQDTHC